MAAALGMVMILTTAAASQGSPGPAGEPAPYFQVKSGDNQYLTSDMVKGKVVVLFYENKDVTKKNKELKNQLQKFYKDAAPDLQQEVVRLVVINCTSAFALTLPIWKSKLREGSRKEGLTIYGDWDGNMLNSYQMSGEDSNFLIIDRQGVIRYATTGLVSADRIPGIKELLRQLVLAPVS